MPCNIHTHWLAAQGSPQSKASRRVCLPRPRNKIFKNAPRTTEKENNMILTDKNIDLLNRLTLWTKG